MFTAVSNEINHELWVVIPARRTEVVDPEGDEAEEAGRRREVAAQVVDVLSVQAAPAMLAPREREAVVMRMQWQLSVAEAAELMRLSTGGAVKRYTADGVRRLREQLAA